ncbi:hypothetical protein [Nitrosopumilus sp.]|uniref:hypothetical protein n=1 Tax=Nitrosopumilus sp. TaxID=2024843 RepID=UPI00292CBFB5|nr:hypothetical protein [Nitrosopumilus sp.]
MKTIAYLLICGFLFKTGFISAAYAAVGTPGCGMFEIREGCELGGWMHLVLGDVIIGALLAIFLHVLAHRNNIKLENNARTIQKIIEMQEEQRNRRKDYSVFNLKNLFTHMLHILGQVNKSVINFNSTLDLDMEQKEKKWRQEVLRNEIQNEENRLARVIDTTRNNLLSVNDVLEPEVVNQIEGVCMYISEIKLQESSFDIIHFPKYQTSKKKIKYVIEKLNTYTIESHSFAKIAGDDFGIREDKTKNNRKILNSAAKENSGDV